MATLWFTLFAAGFLRSVTSAHVSTGGSFDCRDGYEQYGALCYPYCNSGYTGVGPVCWEECPSGFSDAGAICIGDSYTKQCCCSVFGCCGCSDESYHDMGCICTKTFVKSSYGRGPGLLPGMLIGEGV